jgi:hypothetical protein
MTLIACYRVAYAYEHPAKIAHVRRRSTQIAKIQDLSRSSVTREETVGYHLHTFANPDDGTDSIQFHSV